MSLDCVKDSLLPGETTPCNATAADPDGDPLTYTWSTSAGKITGSGATTTLDTAGVPCGTTITVTVTVSDGRERHRLRERHREGALRRRSRSPRR